MIFLCFLCTTAMAQQPHQDECWLNMETGEWELGLFGHFAVYQCRNWYYEQIKEEKNCRLYTLRNKNERLTICMNLLNGSTGITSFNGGKRHRLQRLTAKNACKFYPPEDTVISHQTSFQPDTVTLTGYWAKGNNQTIQFHIPQPFSDEHRKISTQTDSAGLFTIRIPVWGTHIINIRTDRLYTSLAVSPGSIHYIYLTQQSLSSPTLIAMGPDARLINELQITSQSYTASIDYNEYQKLDCLSFFQMLHQKYSRQQAAMQNMYRSFPNISFRFKQINRVLLTESALSTLLQYRFIHKKFIPDMLQWADTLMQQLQIIPEALLLTGQSSLILTDYIGYYDWQKNLDETGCFNLKALHRAIESDISLELPDSCKQILKKAILAEDQLHKSSSSESDTLSFITYQKLRSRTAHFLGGSSAIPNSMELWKIMKIWESLDILDDLPLSSSWRNYATALIATIALQQSHIPLPLNILKELTRRITSPDIYSYVEQIQNNYQTLQTSYYNYLGCLKDNKMLLGLTDGQTILNHILAPYRGKVIYIDVWGSWCAPCKNDMKKYAPTIKKAMKGKDIVFLYLANRTSEKSWRSIIREYHCVSQQTVHYNLPDKQQKAVEKVLEIHSYPSYILIDRQGRIITTKAPPPWKKKELLDIFKKLLKEDTP